MVNAIMVTSGVIVVSTSPMLTIPSTARASQVEDLPILDNNIIQNRINFKEYSVFRPGKENGDIFYPIWYFYVIFARSLLYTLVYRVIL